MPIPVAVAAGISIAGFVLGALGSISSANAKKRALRRQAEYEEKQAVIAMQDAAYEAWRREEAGNATLARAKVNYAASGVDPTIGTPADTQGQLAAMTEIAVQMAEVQGNRVAWTHRERARLLRAGVSDVSAALPFEIAAMGAQAIGTFAMIGQPANPSGVTAAGGAPPWQASGGMSTGSYTDWVGTR